MWVLSCAVGFTPLVQAARPIFYDQTWAGSVQLQQNESSAFNFAEATLVMPKLSLPKRPHEVVDQYTASFWVGLDGYNSPADSVSGLWQAGVVMHIWTNGTTQYTAFDEWIPDPEDFFANFTIHENDHIVVTLNTSSQGLEATSTLKNLNTTSTISHTGSAPTSWRGPTWPAPGASVEWIVESRTYPNYTKHVLPDYSNAVFLDAKACRTDGSCVSPGQPETQQMFANFWPDTNILYSTTKVEGSTVVVQYVEEECDQCKQQCLRDGTCQNNATSAI